MIPVEAEKDAGNLPYERCCFCRKPTPYWTTLTSRPANENVACCKKCAEVYRIKDVPSKRYWCEKEQQIREAISPTLSLTHREPYSRPAKKLGRGY